MNELPGWSLKQEIQKRKTQETMRALESRVVKTPSLAISQPKTSSLPASPNPQSMPHRLALIGQPSRPRIRSKGAVHPFADWTKRQKQIAIVASILLVTVFLVTAVVATYHPFSQPALPALPSVSSSDFITYLRTTGIAVANLRFFSVPNALWSAEEEIQFEVYEWGTKGIFVILSYPSPAQAGIDAFKATYDPKFNQWNLTQISNVLLLAAPGTSAALKAEIENQLSRYLVVPYRPFILTAL